MNKYFLMMMVMELQNQRVSVDVIHNSLKKAYLIDMQSKADKFANGILQIEQLSPRKIAK